MSLKNSGQGSVRWRLCVDRTKKVSFMENKKMVNFFKKWEGMSTLGISLMAGGVFLLWIGMSYFSYILAIALLAVGGAAFIYGNFGRGNATQLDDSIKEHWASIRFPELEEVASLRKRTPKEPEELTFEGFEMEEGLYFKKAKDASVISSKYTCIKMIVLNDAFYLKKHTFSFVNDEKSTETHDITFESIKEIGVLRNALTVGHDEKKRFSVKTCHVFINYGDGKQVLLPKKDDIYVEDFAEELKKKCAK